MNYFEFGFFDELSKIAADSADPMGRLRVSMGNRPAPMPPKKPMVTAGPNVGTGVSPKLNTTMPIGSDPSALARLNTLSGPMTGSRGADAMRGAMRGAEAYVRKMKG